MFCMDDQCKKRFKRMLDNDLIPDKCNCNYCFLKTFLEIIHPEPIVLYQLKCLEMFKWDMNLESDEELEMNDIAIIWAEEGWAKAFREEFSEELSVKEVYKRVKNRVEKE